MLWTHRKGLEDSVKGRVMLVSEPVEGDIHLDTGFAGPMAVLGTHDHSAKYLQRMITLRSLSNLLLLACFLTF